MGRLGHRHLVPPPVPSSAARHRATHRPPPGRERRPPRRRRGAGRGGSRGRGPAHPPSEADARDQLSTLHVGYEDNVAYDRTDFTHWVTISGTCDTRETVLKRDGTGVTTDSACRATSGSWRSVYDDQTFTNASDLDIDHVVPLAEAWGSGANLWTDAERRAFANDLAIPQLVAVSASSNRSKSDRDPAEWQPPSTGWHCQYARSWIQVKYVYDLEVNSAEKTALTGMLDAAC